MRQSFRWLPSRYPGPALVLTVIGCALLLGTPSPAREAPLNEADIAATISNALVVDDGVSGYRVDVTVDNGIASLTGSVNNLLAKKRAARIAETVKGVRSVVNKLVVTGGNRSDSKIKDDVEAALLVNPATESYELEARVEDSRVTLTGTVQSWQEKQLAGKIVQGVRGVTGVDNEAGVEYEEERLDTEIQAEIEQKLHWDALIDDVLVEVDVDDGYVTLSGKVGSAAEKQRAVSDAWTMGVEAVDDQKLGVESWARDERFRTGKYEVHDDTRIVDAVNDALMYDARVNSSNIDVAVNNGIVTLTGKVEGISARRAAAQDARNTVGVWRVKNQLRVRPEDVDDAELARNARAALNRDTYVGRHDITVTVVNGEVILNGKVDTYFEKTQAEDAAAEVYGVVNVDNNIDVSDEYDALTYDPYIDEFDYYNFYEYNWYSRPQQSSVMFSDWQLQEEIRDEIWWSPYVDSDDVTVTVEDGIATLKGTVDTWRERQIAEKNVYEAGALVVQNELDVDYGPEYYQPQSSGDGKSPTGTIGSTSDNR